MKTFKQAYKSYSLLRGTNAAHLHGTTRVSFPFFSSTLPLSTLSFYFDNFISHTDNEESLIL